MSNSTHSFLFISTSGHIILLIAHSYTQIFEMLVNHQIQIKFKKLALILLSIPLFLTWAEYATMRWYLPRDIVRIKCDRPGKHVTHVANIGNIPFPNILIKGICARKHNPNFLS